MESRTSLTVTQGALFERLMLVNVLLVVFNLIPAFPMDGGRVLRALLAMRMDYARAIRTAAKLGQGIAFVFGLLGLFGSPFLVFIALFDWIGASQESAATQLKSARNGVRLADVMIPRFRASYPDVSLRRAVEYLLSDHQQNFPIMSGGALVGELTRTDLLTALAQHGQDVPVRGVMQRDVRSAEAAEMVDTISARLQDWRCHTVPVLQEGALVGLVTMENIGEFTSVQAAREQEAR